MIGIVLAGGRGSRMGGGDKAMTPIGGVAVLDRVLARLEPQCRGIVISANGDRARFARYRHRVVADDLPDQPGPLAGILAAMDDIAARDPAADFAVTVPVDVPFLPTDLVARLQDRRVADRAAIVRARSGDSAHPAVALWSLALREDLRRAMVTENLRKVGAFQARHPLASVTWPMEPVDPFLNLNTPEDVAAADRIAARLG